MSWARAGLSPSGYADREFCQACRPPWERKFGWLGRPSLANQTLLPTGQAGAGASSIVYV